MLTRLCVFLNTQVQPVQSLLSVLSSMIPEPKNMSCIVDFINWNQVLQLCILIGCGFFFLWSPSAAEKSVFDGGEDYTYLWL